MRITNTNALFAYRQMGIHQNRASQALQRLSSGYRINSAADDPAGMAIAERMRAQLTMLRRQAMNAEDHIAFSDAAEGALNEVHSMLNRLTDITAQAADGTKGEAERKALQAEADQILAEIDRIAGATKWGDMPMLQGEAKYAEVSKVELKNPLDGFGKMRMVIPDLAAVQKLLSGLDVTTQAGALAGMDAVKQGIGMVSGMRGALGAQSNAAKHSVNALTEQADNLEEALSNIVDADMAKEMMIYVKESVLGQAAQLMFAHSLHEQYRIVELVKSGTAATESGV